MRVVEDYGPDIRISGSDGVDFYNLSSFDKNPARATTLQQELDSWAAAQRGWLDAAPGAVNYFLVGNHEDRLRRWIWKHPEFYGLDALSLKQLFQFDQLDLQMADKDGLELNIHNRLIITHGSLVRKYSCYTARGEAEQLRYQFSVMSGHTHRGGRFFTTTRGTIIEAIECFCLCSLEPEYKPYPDWQQGIVLAEVTRTSQQFELVPFYQERGKLVARFREKEYRL